MKIAPIHNIWENVPVHVRAFLMRALIIFVLWKLIYHLLLFPIHFPDQQLTQLTAKSTGILYSFFIKDPLVVNREEVKNGTGKSVIFIQGRRAIGIADGCNGLELYVLYIGFLFCLPSTAKRRVLFCLGGIIVIFILNNFRCFGLAWLYLNDYPIANFAHHYLFKMIIYGVIFYGWVLYSKKISFNEH